MVRRYLWLLKYKRKLLEQQSSFSGYLDSDSDYLTGLIGSYYVAPIQIATFFKMSYTVLLVPTNATSSPFQKVFQKNFRSIIRLLTNHFDSTGHWSLHMTFGCLDKKPETYCIYLLSKRNSWRAVRAVDHVHLSKLFDMTQKKVHIKEISFLENIFQLNWNDEWKIEISKIKEIRIFICNHTQLWVLEIKQSEESNTSSNFTVFI